MIGVPKIRTAQMLKLNQRLIAFMVIGSSE